MAIAEHGGLAYGLEPVRIHQRMARGGDHLDVFHPNIAQVRGHEFGGTENVCLVLRQRTDAGDTQQFFQFTQKPLLVFAGVDNGGGRIQMRRS